MVADVSQHVLLVLSGGTGIFTGVDVTQYSALLLMTGTAPFTTLLGRLTASELQSPCWPALTPHAMPAAGGCCVRVQACR